MKAHNIDRSNSFIPATKICVTNPGENTWGISMIFDEYIYWVITLLNGTTLWHIYVKMAVKIIFKLDLPLTVRVSAHCFGVTSPCLCDTFPKFGDLFTHRGVGNVMNHTAYQHIWVQGDGCVCVKNYPPQIMQPLLSTRATIVWFPPVCSVSQNITNIVWSDTCRFLSGKWSDNCCSSVCSGR